MQTENSLQPQRDYWIDVARFIAILCITSSHAVNRSFVIYGNTFNEAQSIPILVTIIKSILFAINKIGVPLFLMISGSLLLKKDFTVKENLVRFIKHNWLPLLITTEIWLNLYFWYIQGIFPDSLLHKSGLKPTLINWVETIFFINLNHKLSTGLLWYLPMILTVYLLIPVYSLGVKYLDRKYIFALIIFGAVLTMLFPDINTLIKTLGHKKQFNPKFYSKNLFSQYTLYILTGWLIADGFFDKIKTKVAISLNVIIFVTACAVQFWGFTYKTNYHYSDDYNNVLVLLMTMSLFGLCRRCAQSGHIFEKTISYISKISFGIYVTHMLIMEIMNIIIDKHNISYLPSYFILEFTAFFGSVLIISILLKTKYLKKYLFLIKK